jgi:hypothetical protein
VKCTRSFRVKAVHLKQQNNENIKRELENKFWWSKANLINQAVIKINAYS